MTTLDLYISGKGEDAQIDTFVRGARRFRIATPAGATRTIHTKVYVWVDERGRRHEATPFQVYGYAQTGMHGFSIVADSRDDPNRPDAA